MKFAIYIISHNRPECETYWKLREMNYTGDIKIIIDTTDKYIKEYQEKYKDLVVIYNKDDIELDLMDNFEGPKGIATYSREYCLQLAKEQNLDYFMMIDDDLKSVKYRFGKSGNCKVKDFDKMLNVCIDFMENIDILTFGTPNDYIGGKNGDYKLGRGANAYLIKMKTNNDFHFKGRYLEDVLTTILYSKMGKVIFKILSIQFTFDVWQANKKIGKGGCNDIYKDENNYMMMFYPVMSNPSSTKMKYVSNRFTACTSYENVCPKIISGRYKK